MKKLYKKQVCSSGVTALFFSFRRSSVLYLVALMLLSTASLAQTGTVPVNPPASGFSIDGGLKANSAIGDWVAGSAGTGSYVFNNGGTTVSGLNGKLIRDAYDSNTDIVFAEGSKFNSSPNDWAWTAGAASDKSDINNAMYLISTDPATGDTWLIIGGDRLSTNGSSYIDFEFLQKSITRNTHNNKFTSAGADGGRTVNDLSITVGYSGGGSTPIVTVYVWEPAANGYAYKVIPAAALENKRYAATNTAAVDVLFGAFGNTQYQPFAFVEAAVNVTALFGAIDPCRGINVENVIIKTKASDAETAALKDFVEPIPVNLSFGSADISYPAPLCNQGTVDVQFSMGSIREGIFTASSAGLSINAATGQIDLERSTPGNYTVAYAFSTNGCPRTVTTSVQVFTTPDAPALLAIHPTCETSTGTIQITSASESFMYSLNNADFVAYPAGGFTDLAAGNYTLKAKNAASCISAEAQITINAQPATAAAPTVALLQPTCAINKGTIIVTAPTDEGFTYSIGGDYQASPTFSNVAPGSYSVTVKTADGCISESTPVTLNPQPVTPTADAGQAKVLTCATPSVQLNGSLSTAGVTFAWVASDGGSIVSGADAATPTVDKAGTYTLTVTDTRGGCTASDQVVVTGDGMVPSATIYAGDLPELTCNTTSITLAGASNLEGATFVWAGPDGFTSVMAAIEVSVPGVYTLTVTNPSNGCFASKVVEVYDRRAYPDVNAGPDKLLTCTANTVTLEGSSEDVSGIMHYYWTASNGGSIVSGERTMTPIVDAPGTYTLTIENMRIGCSSSDVVVVTADKSQPVVSAKGGTLSCATGSVQLTGASTTAGVTFSWTGPDGFTSSMQNPAVSMAGNYILTVTTPSTGCTASATVTVHPQPVGSEPVVTCHMLDFNYEQYSKGLITTLQTKEGPVAVMGRKRNADGSYATENHAAIFDSQTPTGDDADLYTTNWGQVLIINQDQTSVPNDNQWGGEFILDFSAVGPVTMESLKALDIDNYEGQSWVYLYDAAGNELHKVQLQNLGDNSRQDVDLGNTKGVMRMRVVFDGRNEMNDLAGSGAIDDIKFCVEKEVGTPCNDADTGADEDTDENDEELEIGIDKTTAYPNPFNDRAKVKFRLPKAGKYTVNLYDTKGTLIRQLKTGTAVGGELHTVEVDGRNMSEGMYLVRLVSSSGSKTLKLILQK